MLFIPSAHPDQREEVEEAGYLASASDLMVGLLFVFIIMVVILSQRVLIAEAQRPTSETIPAKPPATTTPDEPCSPAEKVKQPESNSNDQTTQKPSISVTYIIGRKLQEGGVSVIIDPTSGVITLPSDALFPVGIADLNTSGVKVLNRARVILDEILPCYIYSERRFRAANCPENPSEVEIETIFIEGHTDSQPLNRGVYTNWHLGLDRARAVYDVLTAGEIQKFKNERTLDVVGISSYADKRPNKEAPQDAEKNRRVELRFVLAFKPETKQNLVESTDIQDRLQTSVNKK
jgi:chemotaxis protein MotB